MNKEIIGLIAGHSGDSLTDELHERGYQVAIVCGKPEEPGYETADYKIITDLRNKEAIKMYFEKAGVHFFVVGTGVLMAFELAEYLEENGFVSSIDPKNSLLMKNKVKTKQLFEQTGVLTPTYTYYENGRYTLRDVVNDVDKKIGFPCVIKSNTDAVQPRCVRGCSELKEAITNVGATNTDLLIEKYICGGDLTYCIANDGYKTTHIGPIYYSKAKEYGLIGFKKPYVAELTKENAKKIAEIAELIVCSIGLRGVVRIDFIIMDTVIYALEVNSVIVTGYKGSAYPFFEKQGINIASVSIDNAIRLFENREKSKEI